MKTNKIETLELEPRIKYKVQDNGCYNCVSHAVRKHDGYPQIKVKDKTIKVHKHVYTLYHGEAPQGMCIMHKCDNRLCVNPDHFEIGTHKENMEDKKAKGRTHKTSTRLSDRQKKNVYENKNNLTAMELCKKYKISYETLKRIRRAGNEGKYGA